MSSAEREALEHSAEVLRTAAADLEAAPERS
jgi:hypothetical protein